MNRDSTAALLRASTSVLVGAGALALLAWLLGWWTVAVIAVAAIVEWVRGELQLPTRWRPW